MRKMINELLINDLKFNKNILLLNQKIIRNQIKNNRNDGLNKNLLKFNELSKEIFSNKLEFDFNEEKNLFFDKFSEKINDITKKLEKI